MGGYCVSSRRCGCARCRSRGFTGPVVLMTLGVLLLLSEFHVVRFHNSWPVLLIAIGVVQVLAHSASMAGHVDPLAPPPPAPSAPPPAQNNPGQGQVGNV